MTRWADGKPVLSAYFQRYKRVFELRAELAGQEEEIRRSKAMGDALVFVHQLAVLPDRIPQKAALASAAKGLVFELK